ncbi:vWA-MoxR associated conflict system protein [Streptacidiphilus sp. PAMC 29251]
MAKLERAAEALHAVLTSPALGQCLAREGEHPSLLVSSELEPEDVRKAVKEAVRQARADNAVLVVAFLGHGFTTPQQTELYFMVRDSTDQSTMSAVNVGQLLSEAADEPGLEGVIALVDTCRAAGAVPDGGRLAGGIRGGRTRLSVLTAAADQPARDMSLTFALVEILRQGLPEAGSLLYVGQLLTDSLRARVKGQVVGRAEYDNDPYALEGMWLARNPRHIGGNRNEAVGRLGRDSLRQAVEMWRGKDQLPERWTHAALVELQEFARTGQVGEESDPHWRGRVDDVVTALLECARTTEVLNGLLADVLTSELLRSAGRLADFPIEAEGAALLRNLLEHATLGDPLVVDTASPWRGLARLVAALVHTAGLDRQDARLREWVRRLQLTTEFNDALAEFTQRQQQRSLRLVISLAAAWTGWPEEVDAWLVRGGSALPLQKQFRCEPADRKGAEKAIGKALTWARSQLPAPDLLRNVDVAAPAHLLAQWQPEEAKVSRDFILGNRRTVVARWSGRLDPGNAEINDAAREALRVMGACGTVRVDWVTAATLRDRPALERSLMAGRYAAALGVDHHPEDLQELLELLLPYMPIILWPRADALPLDGRLQALVRQHWNELPDGFATAYSDRWVEGAGYPTGLGDIRAVWHDEAWLEFCRPFENRVVTAPEEDL